MDKCYLIIIVILAGLFIYKNKGSGFTNTVQSPIVTTPVEENINKLDTRYQFPTVPPVNPNIYKSVIVNSVPAESGLFSNQEMIANGYVLGQNGGENGGTNQLNYSGGTNQLIKIPLQTNDPFNEQLRSQNILITPYNKIKYKTTTD